jgi:hypothetical protein
MAIDLDNTLVIGGDKTTLYSAVANHLSIFRVEEQFLNLSGANLYLTDRHNVRIYVPAIAGKGELRFVIRKLYRFNRQQMPYLRNYFEEIRPRMGTELAILKEEFEKLIKDKGISIELLDQFILSFDISVSASVLKDHEYYDWTEGGVILSTRNSGMVNQNDYSPYYTRKKLEMQRKVEELVSNLGQFNCSIDFVDNDQTLESRFFIFLGDLIELKPEKDPTRENGIWVKKLDRADPSSVIAFRLNSSALEEIGIFASREGARKFATGDIKLAEKIENERIINELKHDVEMAKIEWERAKYDWEKNRREEIAEQENITRKQQEEALRTKQKLEADLAAEKFRYEQEKYAWEKEKQERERVEREREYEHVHKKQKHEEKTGWFKTVVSVMRDVLGVVGIILGAFKLYTAYTGAET